LPVPETAPISPKNAYGETKAAAERLCRVFAGRGLQVSVLRFTNVYGPRDFGRVIPVFIESALQDKPLRVYGGRQVLDFIWVGEVIDALIKAGFGRLESPLNVGSGVGTGILELAERIRAAAGSRSEIQILPPRRSEVVRFVADMRNTRRVLNWCARQDPLRFLPLLLASSDRAGGLASY
jgi:UDP-glucose 4-epimerase